MDLGYDPKTDRVLNDATDGFTADDFARLALACLDQAGLSVSDQDKVADLLADILSDCKD